MSVRVHSHLSICVSQALADRLGVNVAGDKDRGMGVPKCMEVHMWQVMAFQKLWEPLAYRIRVKRHAVPLRKYKVARLPKAASALSLFVLHLLVFFQNVDYHFRQCYASYRMIVLGSLYNRSHAG